MTTVTKTYTNLSAHPERGIQKCSALLPNHMQCWRAADVLVTVVTKTIIPAHDEVAEDIEETISSYQLCRRHAQIDEDAYITTKLAEVTNAAKVAPATAEVKEETADAESTSASEKLKS